ncbi:MAG: hypothetical protein ACPLN0_04730 [Candidatus Hydrothermia bacterium]
MFTDNRISEIQKEIFKTADELFAISMLDTKTLKTFLNNLLLLEEVKENIFQILEPFADILKNPRSFSKLSNEITQLVSEEIINFFTSKDVFLDFEMLQNIIPSLLSQEGEKNMEKRYRRIVRTVMHMFNTPLTSVAIILNIEKNYLTKILGEEENVYAEQLIQPGSWRDRVLKMINYYTSTFSFGTSYRYLLTFFKGYIKLTNIFEILNKEFISSDDKMLLIKNIGEPMVEITGGLVNYKELHSMEGGNLSITSILKELKEVVFNMLTALGKQPSPAKEAIFTNNLMYSVASLLVIGADIDGLKLVNEDEGRKAEKLRVKLAKLLIEKYRIDTEDDLAQKVYEGESIWRSILIDRELCKNRASVFTLLGFPVKNTNDYLNYDKFFLK